MFSFYQIIIGALIVGVVFFISQFMYILPVHIGSFIITITAVIIADIHATLWTLGKLSVLPLQRMNLLHYLVSIGLLASVTSGFIMFLPLQEYLFSVTAFWLKMIFVLALIVNSFVISHHLKTITSRTFASLTKNERQPLFISGFISAISWIGAFISALFLGL